MQAAGGQSQARLRVATLNLWGWFGDWPARRARLARHWHGIDTDVLFVQEASTRGQHDQIAETAELLGYEHVVRGACQSDKLGSEGLAILSRLALEGPRVVDLPASRPTRCLLVATVRAGGAPVELATSHTSVRPADLRHASSTASWGWRPRRSSSAATSTPAPTSSPRSPPGTTSSTRTPTTTSRPGPSAAASSSRPGRW